MSSNDRPRIYTTVFLRSINVTIEEVYRCDKCGSVVFSYNNAYVKNTFGGKVTPNSHETIIDVMCNRCKKFYRIL